LAASEFREQRSVAVSVISGTLASAFESGYRY
jgi:hypothetical protein